MADRPDSRRDEAVAIVGAGFSGTLQAINLLRHDGPRAILIERRPPAGRGVAYSAAHPSHLLNVRASNMSALPDDPEHFLRWLHEAHPGLDGFVPRVVYGDYLADLLGEARTRAAECLTLVEGEAVDLRTDADGATVTLADGRALRVGRAILALGNLPPHAPPGLDPTELGPDRYVDDPWTGDPAGGLDDDDTVLALGTGLTMVDVALLLDARGFRGRIVAMSRRGLKPHAHADVARAASRLAERPSLPPSRSLRAVRRRADMIGWRAAVDELRPYTQDMWLAASPEEQRRFLRHLRPWWDIHRHRLAPQVAARIAQMQASGRLEVVAGKLAGVRQTERGVHVGWRARGEGSIRQVEVRRIVNCTGPQGDLRRTSEPLLHRLLARGAIRADRQNLGIAVNPQSEAIGADGAPNPRLLVLGPMTRGTFWEIVAVPDIRVQTWSVARRLANAHWVEGEGL